LNKFVQPRPYANPEVAARKLLEIANAAEPAAASASDTKRNAKLQAMEHVRVSLKAKPGNRSSALRHPSKSGRGQRKAA
jgi:hypothetical protein